MLSSAWNSWHVFTWHLAIKSIEVQIEANQEGGIEQYYKKHPDKFSGTIFDILKRGNENEIIILKNNIIYSIWIFFYNRYNELILLF